MTDFVDEVELPTLHADQVRAWSKRTRRFAVRCGRRWGKTKFGETIGGDSVVKGWPVGWFAPDYRRMSEVFEDFKQILGPIITRKSKQDKEIRVDTGGGLDFWTLEDPNAGRGRRYKIVIVDEAAFGDDKTMMDTWQQSIEPTLLDFSGDAIVLSNTNGNDPANFMWRICNQPEHGFTEYHAPSYRNPLVPMRKPGESETDWLIRRALVFEDIKRSRPPLVYQQEYLAEFVDWSGAAFFELAKMMGADGKPVAFPLLCDGVFAVIDSATKTGKENDGTAVTYFATTRAQIGQYPLVILDWDVKQIEGALLETWLPSVFERLQELATLCRARMGSLGAFIEDKASGMILLQQAARRGWAAHAIDSKLTAVGKSERAINVSGYVYRGLVKLSQHAHDKVVVYKGVSKNHLMGQVLGFRVGSKDQTDDDLLDDFCYGIAIALGNAEGF